MADSPVEEAAATGGGGDQPTTPCFKLFGTRIVTETTTTINNPTKENERTSESGTSSPEKPTTATSAAATAAATGLACPRCKSRETKFCYFNNYNVNQPRHFCRGCHRYWTAGGALRNVPVGAGRRKAARPPSHAEGGGVFGFSTGLDGVVVQQWLMSHDGFPAKRPNISSFHDRIR